MSGRTPTGDQPDPKWHCREIEPAIGGQRAIGSETSKDLVAIERETTGRE